jgi:hypothetical protein
MDHTVIAAGHHRLLIETIPVAPANYRYPGTPSVPLVQRTAGIGATSLFHQSADEGRVAALLRTSIIAVRLLAVLDLASQPAG